jgi:biopolymer transport protein ExbD
MLKRTERIDTSHKRLNIIPILDAVFIFIFFLLFSTQFVKIYVIESDVPIVSEIPNEEIVEDEPLNLTVKISTNQIILTKGIDNNIFKTFSRGVGFDLSHLKNVVLNLKKEFPKEKFIIISPEANVKYDDVIKVIDAVKKLPENIKVLKLKKDGKLYQFAKIFEQIVLVPSE